MQYSFTLNPALIEKFFRKECTPHEAMEVALYLKANPQVLEKYMSIEDWEATGKELMPEDFWNEAWENIQKKNKQRHLLVTIKRVTTVAACLIIITSVIFYFYPSQKTTQQPVITAQLQPKAKRKSVINTTNKVLNMVLPDSSLVKLSPASTVQYDEPFPADKRDIFLDGEAEFHVTKDKKKPFTVYAGAFATTALGTIFSVKKNAAENIINVKLFKGKVVIHSTDSHLKGWKDDVYLSPGEQLKFNAENMLLAVNKIETVHTGTPVKTKKPVTASPSENELVFSNTTLPKVVEKLSAYYNTKITYDSLLIDRMNFTGTISKKDSLPVILKAITQMNNLDLIRNNDGFIISKHQE